MISHLILALAWIVVVGSFFSAVVALWRLRRSAVWSRPRAWGLSAGLVLVWSVLVWGFLIEPELLYVRHVTIESDRWSGPPVRLGLISDTHAGSPHDSTARIGRIVQRMNGEHPDLVILLGDYAGDYDRNKDVLPGIAAFRRLAAPLGVAGVIGNHDVAYGRAPIEAAMRAAGVTVLGNSAVQILRPEGSFWLAGLNSMADFKEAPSVTKALKGVPEGAPVILAMHEPDLFARTPVRVGLTLAGHTHCGQISLPLIGPPWLPSRGSRRWPCHQYKVGSRDLYVTGGTGVSTVPVRFGAPPEIVIVTLKGPGAP
jgi:predicted MPP superfamily phosphohydrolase